MPRPDRCACSSRTITASRPLDFYTYLSAGRTAAPRSRATGNRSRHWSSSGLQSESESRGSARIVDELLAFCAKWEAKRDELPYEIDGVVAKVDSHRAAAAARLDGEGAALGDRVQVPGAPGGDRRREYRSAGGTHRRADAGRASEAGDRRAASRCRARRCTTRTRSSGWACRSATRS